MKKRPSTGRFAGFMPGVSLDCVVFGYRDRTLHVLLLRYPHTEAWALPGGFLPLQMTMDEAVSKILAERTGVHDIFLEQFHTFSGVDRGWRDSALSRKALENLRPLWTEEEWADLLDWFDQRFVSTAFLALVNAQVVTPQPDELSEVAQWIPVGELPPLVLDHAHMVEKALQHLRRQVNYLPIGRELLEDKFTMSELQALYEALLGKKLDRGNFQRKMMKLKILVRHEKLMTGAQHKAPYLYSIDQGAYDALLEEGIGIF